MKKKVDLMKKFIEDYDRNYAYIERFMDESFKNSYGFNNAKREGRELDYILTHYRGKNKDAVKELARDLKNSSLILNEDDEKSSKFWQVVLFVFSAIIIRLFRS